MTTIGHRAFLVTVNCSSSFFRYPIVSAGPLTVDMEEPITWEGARRLKNRSAVGRKSTLLMSRACVWTAR